MDPSWPVRGLMGTDRRFNLSIFFFLFFTVQEEHKRRPKYCKLVPPLLLAEHFTLRDPKMHNHITTALPPKANSMKKKCIVLSLLFLFYYVSVFQFLFGRRSPFTAWWCLRPEYLMIRVWRKLCFVSNDLLFVMPPRKKGEKCLGRLLESCKCHVMQLKPLTDSGFGTLWL